MIYLHQDPPWKAQSQEPKDPKSLLVARFDPSSWQASLTEKDRKEFGFDIRGLHWPTYIDIYAQVAYTSKLSILPIPAAKTRRDAKFVVFWCVFFTKKRARS